ncbi:hypothetical protein HPP92_010631 [Vanilla planifolia]|uniref:Uncharacterized protein n=1 Tax=Vanilla planifolia TaxID=51239 RepID=A0A835RAU0_VANPL|nr:hypothetical protein HPP92_010631 [Vanilla planifolia]
MALWISAHLKTTSSSLTPSSSKSSSYPFLLLNGTAPGVSFTLDTNTHWINAKAIPITAATGISNSVRRSDTIASPILQIPRRPKLMPTPPAEPPPPREKSPMRETNRGFFEGYELLRRSSNTLYITSLPPFASERK